MVFSCPPTGADVGKSAIIANIGVWVLIVVNTLIIFSTELSSHGGNIKLHPRFRAFFDRRAGTGTDGLYPTVTIRQIMWALKMKPLPKQPWETVFDHTPI